MNAYLATLMVCLALAAQGYAEERSIGSILNAATLQGLFFKDREDPDACQIEKPTDKCLPTDDIPVCGVASCKFMPKYGSEFISFWDLMPSIPGYSPYPKQQPKKFKKILDLGEDFTTSFEAEICTTPHKACDCILDECDCDEKPKTCQQKYTKKLGTFFVYRGYYCKPYNPYSYLFEQQNNNPFAHLFGGHDDAEEFNPLYYFLKQGMGSKAPFNPFSQMMHPPQQQHHPGQSPNIMQSMMWMFFMKNKDFGDLYFPCEYFYPELAKPNHPQPHHGQPQQQHGHPQNHGPHGHPQNHGPHGYQGHPKAHPGRYGLNMDDLVTPAKLIVEVPDGCECK